MVNASFIGNFINYMPKKQHYSYNLEERNNFSFHIPQAQENGQNTQNKVLNQK